MELTVDKFGRILLPKKLRTLLGLRPGSRLRVEAGPDGIALRPSDTEPALAEEDGLLVFRGELEGDATELMGELRDERIRNLGGE
jgi:AbrB family looped-hinge helix DNA binding protein